MARHTRRRDYSRKRRRGVGAHQCALVETTSAARQSRLHAALVNALNADGKVCSNIVKHVRGDGVKWPPALCKPVRLACAFVREAAGNMDVKLIKYEMDSNVQNLSSMLATCPCEQGCLNVLKLNIYGEESDSLDGSIKMAADQGSDAGSGTESELDTPRLSWLSAHTPPASITSLIDIGNKVGAVSSSSKDYSTSHPDIEDGLHIDLEDDLDLDKCGKEHDGQKGEICASAQARDFDEISLKDWLPVNANRRNGRRVPVLVKRSRLSDTGRRQDKSASSSMKSSRRPAAKRRYVQAELSYNP
eukprot:jgi/Botrbrau1/12928/Bobra.92_1s0008.1